MLQNAYFLAKIGADTAENEQQFAEILPIDRRVAARRHAPSPLALAQQLGRRALVLRALLGVGAARLGPALVPPLGEDARGARHGHPHRAAAPGRAQGAQRLRQAARAGQAHGVRAAARERAATAHDAARRHDGRSAKFRQIVARFRLYRHRSLQENTRFAAFFKIYQIT